MSVSVHQYLPVLFMPIQYTHAPLLSSNSCTQPHFQAASCRDRNTAMYQEDLMQSQAILEGPSPAPESPMLWQELSTQFSFSTLRNLQTATGVSFWGPPQPAASPQLCIQGSFSPPSSPSIYTSRLHPAHTQLTTRPQQ